MSISRMRDLLKCRLEDREREPKSISRPVGGQGSTLQATTIKPLRLVALVDPTTWYSTTGNLREESQRLNRHYSDVSAQWGSGIENLPHSERTVPVDLAQPSPAGCGETDNAQLVGRLLL